MPETVPHKAETQDARQTEDQILRIGYNAMLGERYPILEDIGLCSKEGSAYFFALEEEYLNPPRILWFENLKKDIPEKHQERIETSWNTVIRLKSALFDTRDSLKKHWEKTPIPKKENSGTKDLIEQTPIKLQEATKKTILAVITPTSNSSSENESEIKHWKIIEKALRGEFYKTHKNYIAALRLYYELLLERSDQKQECVLPQDHFLRKTVVINNRYLRVIQLLHGSISVAKAVHHEQKKERLRETSAIPYVYHSLDVTMEIALDVLPFILEEEKLKLTPSLLFASAPLHDTPEDTLIKITATVKKLIGETNHCDSKIMPAIKSGFNRSYEEMENNHMDIIRDKSKKQIGQILRIVSNNTVLDEEEKIKVTRAKEKIQTLKDYPEDFDSGKMTRFIERLESISESHAVQQSALIIKLADRISNILEMEGLSVERQLKTLRSTVARLINYAIHDYKNHEEHPLYNTLPRLVNVTMNKYKSLSESNPGDIEKIDCDLYSKLTAWDNEIKTLPLPEKATLVMSKYRDRKKEIEETKALAP